MASHVLKIDLSSSVIPELGSPVMPLGIRDSKVKKNDKDDYRAYISEVSMARKHLQDIVSAIPGSVCQMDVLKVNLPFETETSKTYKFLGMDIDRDFNAVIPVSGGHVIVASMYDRDAVRRCWDRTVSSYNNQNPGATISERFITNIPEDTVRKVVTGLKTGLAYDIGTDGKSTMGNYLDPSFLKKLFSLVKDDVESNKGNSLIYKSIILNLIHGKKAQNELVSTKVSVDTIASYVVKSLLDYWSTILVPHYNSVYSVLSMLDLWTDIARRTLGPTEATNRLAGSCTIFDASTGEIYKNASFSGVSRNGGISDANIIRTSASSGFEKISNALVNSNADPFDLKNVLAGFVDTDMLGDVYSVSEPELQALGVLDSLRYVDEDAAVCSDTYDMSDPEQRGLYVKSVIRSYERNFREFKPAKHYDVTDALAEMVERGDVISRPVLVSQEVLNPDSDDVEGEIVTSTVKEIDVKVDTANLKKVMKLVYKCTSSILKKFT